MANTTFNGPVRSENGFQELVDGVWTPVGGGGGGGGTATMVPYNAFSVSITLPSSATATAGQKVASYYGEFVIGSYYPYNLVINATANPAVDSSIIMTTTSADPSSVTSVFPTGPNTATIYTTGSAVTFIVDAYYFGTTTGGGSTYDVWFLVATMMNP